MSKQTRKVDQMIKKEHSKQLDIIYSACFTVLWQDYQWREKRIIGRFSDSAEIWMQTKTFSMLEVMEQETGIEMSLDGEKSYHEFAYLSSDTTVKPISDAEYIYMMQRVSKWIPTMILASICLALYRKDKWGHERLSRFIYKVNLLLQLYGTDAREYDKVMYKATGHHTKEFWGK